MGEYTQGSDNGNWLGFGDDFYMSDDSDDNPTNPLRRAAMHQEPPIMTNYGKLMRTKAENLIELVEIRKQRMKNLDRQDQSEDIPIHRLGVQQPV